jgi:hypothetical protein
MPNQEEFYFVIHEREIILRNSLKTLGSWEMVENACKPSTQELRKEDRGS